MTENPKFKRAGGRTKARARAVDLLYEAETRDVDPVELAEERQHLSTIDIETSKPVRPYTVEIISGVAETLDEVDAAIARNLSSDWAIDRLPPVERAVLRVAAWELLYNDDVPFAVSVSEGIELASQYSHVKAGSYVHAVLDGVRRDAQLSAAQREAADAQPAEDAQPTEAAQPAEAAQPTEAAQPAEDAQPAAEAAGAEEAQSAEQPQSAEDTTAMPASESDVVDESAADAEPLRD